MSSQTKTKTYTKFFGFQIIWLLLFSKNEFLPK